MELREFADSVWIAATPIRFAGIWFPHVMTVVRLADGSLLLHSPCHSSEQLTDSIRRIGSVAHVVAPNWFHDLYLTEYRALYPDATLWGPSRLAKLVDRVLSSDAQTPWYALMPHLTLPGFLALDESIFFHRPSGTLIVADLLMNVPVNASTPPFTAFAYRLSRIDGRLGLPPYLRLFRFTVGSSLELAAQQIAAWNPERLIVGHGDPLSSGASLQLQRAMR